jgi:hypothetical protein
MGWYLVVRVDSLFWGRVFFVGVNYLRGGTILLLLGIDLVLLGGSSASGCHLQTCILTSELLYMLVG